MIMGLIIAFIFMVVLLLVSTMFGGKHPETAYIPPEPFRYKPIQNEAGYVYMANTDLCIDATSLNDKEKHLIYTHKTNQFGVTQAQADKGLSFYSPFINPSSAETHVSCAGCGAPYQNIKCEYCGRNTRK